MCSVGSLVRCTSDSIAFPVKLSTLFKKYLGKLTTWINISKITSLVALPLYKHLILHHFLHSVAPGALTRFAGLLPG